MVMGVSVCMRMRVTMAVSMKLFSRNLYSVLNFTYFILNKFCQFILRKILDSIITRFPRKSTVAALILCNVFNLRSILAAQFGQSTPSINNVHSLVFMNLTSIFYLSNLFYLNVWTFIHIFILLYLIFIVNNFFWLISKLIYYNLNH